MSAVTIHQAKTHLSRLIAQAEAGEEVIISRGKVPVAKLVPLTPPAPKKRVGGWLAHTVPPGKDPLEDGFWDPLPDDELALWNGEVDDPNDAPALGHARDLVVGTNHAATDQPGTRRHRKP